MYAILLCALLAGDVDVEPKGGTSRKPAPLLVSLHVKGDKLVHHETRTVTRTVLVQKQQIVNGQTVTIEEAIPVTSMVTVELAWDLKKAAATAGGKNLDLADLKKKLDKPTLVVISSDGKPIDSAYLNLFAKDTIVIVAPQLGTGDKGPAPPGK